MTSASNTEPSVQDAASSYRRTVAVIGAGVSGLTAAALLHRAGLRVSVLEAGDRAGGRVRSVWQGRTRLAMGAMWLHGGQKNPLYQPLTHLLGNKLNATDNEDTIEDVFVWSSHSDVAANLARTESGIDVPLSQISQANSMLKSALKIADSKTEHPEWLSVAEFLSQQKLFDNSLNSSDEPLLSAVLQTVCKLYGKSEGVHRLSRLGLLGQSAYRDLDGGNLFAWGAYDELVRVLSEYLPEGCLRLDSKVEKVTLTADGAASLLIDGQWHQFDHALVTVSLGVLQAGQLIESRLVSPERQLALSQMSLGLVDKVFVCLDGKIPLPSSCWHMWIVREHLSDTWLDGLFSLSVVSRDRDIVMFWIAGDFAKSMEAKTNAELIADINGLLENLLRAPVPNILKIIRSNFGSNPSFLGSYSHFLPGSNPQQHHLAIAQPISPSSGDPVKPAICFAGEHTHPHYFSTVHGAALSGVREARRLVRYCGLDEAAADAAQGGAVDAFLASLLTLAE